MRTSKYNNNSFRYAAAVLRNSFPDDFRKVSNFNQFKSLISKWNGVGIANGIYVDNCLHMTVCVCYLCCFMCVCPSGVCFNFRALVS